MTTDLQPTYTIQKARYAKGKLAIHCKPDGSGWRTLPQLVLSKMPGVRYSNRESAYIVSPGRAAKFEAELNRAEAVRARYRLVNEAHATGRAIDHIDGDITNNEISNLRVATLQGDRR